MPFLETIVKHINDSLKASSLNTKRFQVSNLMGISTIVPVSDSKGKQKQVSLWPGIVSIQGEVDIIDLNDDFDLHIYHKTIGTGHALDKASHGNEYDYKDTTEMSMMIYGQGDKLKVSMEQLETIIRIGFPLRLSDDLMASTGLKSCMLSTLATDLDKLRVFRQEYPNTDYFLKPESIFFLIRYRIETRFNRKCLDACDCRQ